MYYSKCWTRFTSFLFRGPRSGDSKAPGHLFHQFNRVKRFTGWSGWKINTFLFTHNITLTHTEAPQSEDWELVKRDTRLQPDQLKDVKTHFCWTNQISTLFPSSSLINNTIHFLPKLDFLLLLLPFLLRLFFYLSTHANHFCTRFGPFSIHPHALDLVTLNGGFISLEIRKPFRRGWDFELLNGKLFPFDQENP